MLGDPSWHWRAKKNCREWNGPHAVSPMGAHRTVFSAVIPLFSASWSVRCRNKGNRVNKCPLDSANSLIKTQSRCDSPYFQGRTGFNMNTNRPVPRTYLVGDVTISPSVKPLWTFSMFLCMISHRKIHANIFIQITGVHNCPWGQPAINFTKHWMSLLQFYNKR